MANVLIKEGRSPDLVLLRPGIEKSGERRWNHVPPLGLAYLAAIARLQTLDVRVVDGRLLGHRSCSETVASTLSLAPKFVGVSAMTVDFPRAIDIARSLKRADSTITTILGGSHSNAIPGESLSEAKDFDYVLAGEPLFELANLVLALRDGRSPSRIPGLWWREAGRINGPHEAAFLEQDQVQCLPFPAWDLFPPSRTYPVITQLGCPFRCVFCCHNSSRSMRYRPVDAVLEEITWLERQYHPTAVTFIDENFGLKHERTCQLLASMARLGLDRRIQFSAQTRVDCVSEDLLRLMKSAGFEFIELGVESGDPEVLEQSGKNIHLEMVESAVHLAQRAGLKVWLKFILGLPGETIDSIRRSIRLAVALNPHRLSVATIVPYPGSQIYDWARSGERGYRLLSSNWGNYDKYMGKCLELDGIPSRTLQRLQVQMYLETYIRNGRLGQLCHLAFQNASLMTSYFASVLRRNHAR